MCTDAWIYTSLCCFAFFIRVYPQALLLVSVGERLPGFGRFVDQSVCKLVRFFSNDKLPDRMQLVARSGILVSYMYYDFCSTGVTARRCQGCGASAGRFPYMCSLRQRDSRAHVCSEALVFPFWVLTAAHCFKTSLPDMSRLLRSLRFQRRQA